MRPRKATLVLKHPNNDPWRNPLLLCESSNRDRTARRSLNEVFPGRSGNQSIRSPLIGLSFEVRVTPVYFVHKDALLAMQQNMRCFVEKAEPQMIV